MIRKTIRPELQHSKHKAETSINIVISKSMEFICCKSHDYNFKRGTFEFEQSTVVVEYFEIH